MNSQSIPPHPTPVVFYVVRHGQTLFNVTNRVQGWCDSPLTEEGRRVALMLGAGLARVPFVRAYASDSQRTLDTAALILQAQHEAVCAHDERACAQELLQCKGDARLREWCYGDLEGGSGERLRETLAQGFGEELSFAELNERLVEVADILAQADTSGRAEYFETIETRLRSFFEQIGTEVQREGGGNVLVVTHAFVVRTLVYLLDRTRVNTPLKIQNASVTQITYDQGLFQLGEIGSVAWIDQ
ncbi:histidine phosphatase family protein [Eggerthellaceae bacterium 3-80]|nr:histidine phosphatase family protein [bacterium D16-34]